MSDKRLWIGGIVGDVVTACLHRPATLMSKGAVQRLAKHNILAFHSAERCFVDKVSGVMRHEAFKVFLAAQKLRRPLLSHCSAPNNDQPLLPTGPLRANTIACLDGLFQADFVRQDGTFRKR